MTTKKLLISIFIFNILSNNTTLTMGHDTIIPKNISLYDLDCTNNDANNIYVVKYDNNNKRFRYKTTLIKLLQTEWHCQRFKDDSNYCFKELASIKYHPPREKYWRDKAYYAHSSYLSCLDEENKQYNRRVRIQRKINRNNVIYCHKVPYGFDYDAGLKYGGAIIYDADNLNICDLYRQFKMENLIKNESLESRISRSFTETFANNV